MESEGARVVSVSGYYYNLAVAPIDEVIPSAALWLTRKLEEGSFPKPDWMAAGMIIKAKKV